MVSILGYVISVYGSYVQLVSTIPAGFVASTCWAQWWAAGPATESIIRPLSGSNTCRSTTKGHAGLHVCRPRALCSGREPMTLASTRVNRVQASSVSAEVMDTTPCLSTLRRPKERCLRHHSFGTRCSLKHTKKEKGR